MNYYSYSNKGEIPFDTTTDNFTTHLGIRAVQNSAPSAAEMASSNLHGCAVDSSTTGTGIDGEDGGGDTKLFAAMMIAV